MFTLKTNRAVDAHLSADAAHCAGDLPSFHFPRKWVCGCSYLHQTGHIIKIMYIPLFHRMNN